MFPISQRDNENAIARTVQTEIADRTAALITFVDSQSMPLSWAQVSQRLMKDAGFLERWNITWANLPFDFEWKPVPIHPYTAETHPFFAIAFPATFRPADPTDFSAHLDPLSADDLTTTFSNFSGDAQLLVPQKTGRYGHIAAFCRTAPPDARRALWQQVGELCTEAIDQKRAVWCNTHGHGVPWLHIRFDKKLKYASFPPRGSISPNSQAIWYQQIYRPVAPGLAQPHLDAASNDDILTTAAPE